MKTSIKFNVEIVNIELYKKKLSELEKLAKELNEIELSVQITEAVIEQEKTEQCECSVVLDSEAVGKIIDDRLLHAFR